MRRIGRYALFGPIASGGMATVHLGRLTGPGGFSRIVAIKRLHENYATAPEFVAAFVDEARLAARIRHPNVVPTLDVLSVGDELFLVLEYVHGETLQRLLEACRRANAEIPPRIASAILSHVLEGLHAAHEAADEHGSPLGIVHRDVSPSNILVGQDGVARVLDFGIAKAEGRLQHTRPGGLKGKIHYMSPEQMLAAEVTRRTDVFAASIVLWEVLAGRRLFAGDDWASLMKSVLEQPIDPPSHYRPELPRAIDDVVLRGLDRDAERRFQSAREMTAALEVAVGVASARDVSAWVEAWAGASLAARAAQVAEVERADLGKEAEIDLEELLRPAPRPPESGTELSLGLAPPPTPRSRSPRAIAALIIVSLMLLVSAGLAAFVGRGPTPAPPEKAAPGIGAETSTVQPRAIPLLPDPAQKEAAALVPKARQSAKAARSKKGASTPRTQLRPEAEEDLCDPPYRIDSAGIRHLKPECL